MYSIRISSIEKKRLAAIILALVIARWLQKVCITNNVYIRNCSNFHTVRYFTRDLYYTFTFASIHCRNWNLTLRSKLTSKTSPASMLQQNYWRLNISPSIQNYVVWEEKMSDFLIYGRLFRSVILHLHLCQFTLQIFFGNANLQHPHQQWPCRWAYRYTTPVDSVKINNLLLVPNPQLSYTKRLITYKSKWLGFIDGIDISQPSASSWLT